MKQNRWSKGLSVMKRGDGSGYEMVTGTHRQGYGGFFQPSSSSFRALEQRLYSTSIIGSHSIVDNKTEAWRPLH